MLQYSSVSCVVNVMSCNYGCVFARYNSVVLIVLWMSCNVIMDVFVHVTIEYC